MSFFPKISFQREVEEYLSKVFRNNEVCETDTMANHSKHIIIFCNLNALK